MESENKYIETDLGNVAPNPRGEYDPAAAYEYLDLVEYGGGSYLCIRESGTVTGVAPAQNKNTDTWQVLTIPGDLTPEYIAMHDDVVNKAESTQTDAASTAADREQVESMLANVEQLHTQTETAAQEASDSRDSAAGYAAAAEASRTAAADSEKNAQLQVTGFNETVNAAKQEATEEITTARKTAVQAVAERQVKSVNAVNAAGSAAIEKTSADAKEAKDAKAEAVSAANAAEDSAREATDAAEQAKNDKQSAETAAAAAKTSAAAAETAQKAVEGAAGQIEENTEGIEALKEDKLNKPALPVVGELLRVKSVSDAGEVGLETEDISELQKRQNILVGSETGNPVSCDDAFAAPLCGLTVYGKSTQDGTPTPDSPVPIVSAGDGGTIAVKMTGKNLLYIPDGKGTARGVTITSKNGIISISGTAAEDGYVYLPVKQISIHGLAILSSNVSATTVKLVSESWNVLFTQGSANNTQGVITRICFIVKEGTNYDLNGINVQLELGSTATAYSPYREQLLTLPTPNGLPGIHVTSGGNYTDPQGKQWVCDEIDLERGVRVQRVDKTAFDTTKSLVEQKATLVTPIENPLTSDEIDAYKALATYAPNTVMQASDGAGIKMDYQRDVNLVIKNLEDAIASMTTT